MSFAGVLHYVRNEHAGMWFTRVIFEPNLMIKENIISTASVLGRNGVGLWMKDRNPTS